MKRTIFFILETAAEIACFVAFLWSALVWAVYLSGA